MQIQYVIAIHLMRWQTNFYDFRFKWTATAAIGIHPTKVWLSQLVNFKNAIWTLEERYAIKFCFNLGKNAMQWKPDLLLWPRDQETEFPMEACRLFQTQEDQTEQIHPQTFDRPFLGQHWHDLHALGSHWTGSQQWILCWSFKGVQQEIPREDACTLQIGSVAFPPGQCTSPQLHPCHRLFEQDGHETVPQPPYLPALAPCDICLFPKLRGCRYETIDEMKVAVTKVIDTLTQGDFHRAFQKLLERYNKCIAAGGDYSEGDYSCMCVLSIKMPIRKMSGNLFNDPRIWKQNLSKLSQNKCNPLIW